MENFFQGVYDFFSNNIVILAIMAVVVTIATILEKSDKIKTPIQSLIKRHKEYRERREEVFNNVNIMSTSLTELQNKYEKLDADINNNLKKLEDKIDEVDQKTIAIADREDEREAIRCRLRILRFGDETRQGIQHSKEHFDQILMDITNYQNYCSEHSKFQNNIVTQTVKRINDIYQHLLETNTFL